MLLDRHLYMILFSIGILLKLNGVKMKFTRPAEEEEDKVDSLDVENKLSLKDDSSRPNLRNIRERPLTSGLLRQLSGFTSDTFYHIYYTSPTTGEEKKQPLKFSQNREAIKSFLPIRNAAIQARDDRACGLLCAILIEGCVDDYSGGEVTEEMVANQMKNDFEWGDEQLSAFSFFLCLLDMLEEG